MADVSSIRSVPTNWTQLCSRKFTINEISRVYLQFLQWRFGLENGKFHQSVMIQVSRNTVYEKMSNGLKLAFAMLNDKLLFVKIESYGIFL